MDYHSKSVIRGFCIILIFYCVQVESAQQQDMSWPISLTFQETKTNQLLGEAVLRRVYARIGFTDNIIRAEMDTLFENLKDFIDKKMRNCGGRRRRGSRSNYDTLYNTHGHGVYNSSYPNQYGQRRY